MDSRPWHAHYDEGVPPDVDFEPLTLVDLFRRTASRFRDRPALIFLNCRLSFRGLEDQVDRFAAALVELGVQPGDRVAIQLPNLPQFVIAYFGTLVAGAIAVPTNPVYTPREIEHQWNDAGCEAAVLADFIYEQRVRGIADRLPIRHYVVASIPEYLRFPLSLLAPLKLRRQKPPLIGRVTEGATVHRFRRLVSGAEPRPPAERRGMDDVATLLYTGGTTGVSKGAMLTHRNLSSNVQQLLAWIPGAVPGAETLLGALPFFHSYGLTVAMNAGIGLGGTIVLIPNPRDIRAIVKAVEKHRITLFAAVPAQFNAITQQPDIERRDLSSIKFCNSGSAPLPVDVLQRFERLTGCRISEGFGLTESSPVTHSNPFSVRKAGSIGLPLPGTDSRVVDADNGSRQLPAGEVGELIIRGPQVMPGYWNRPDETAKTLKEGWLYTGDLCRVDEEGFHFIEGRKKDMILCSGFNVYPDEIDRVLAAHPAVLEAATIGIPDEVRGETVKSFVVLEEGRSATADEIIAYCRENLAPYKVPRFVEFRDSLPKSSVLKVLRRELREEEVAKMER